MTLGMLKHFQFLEENNFLNFASILTHIGETNVGKNTKR
jgi:hypothetical protein